VSLKVLLDYWQGAHCSNINSGLTHCLLKSRRGRAWPATIRRNGSGHVSKCQTASYHPGDIGFLYPARRARYTKKGRGSIQASVAPTLQVDEEFILLDRWLQREPTTDKTQQVYIDVAGVRNPATKARNVRYRLAAGAGWKASFTIAWDVTIVSRESACDRKPNGSTSGESAANGVTGAVLERCGGTGVTAGHFVIRPV
jgi:hypothetical protein